MILNPDICHPTRDTTQTAHQQQPPNIAIKHHQRPLEPLSRPRPHIVTCRHPPHHNQSVVECLNSGSAPVNYLVLNPKNILLIRILSVIEYSLFAVRLFLHNYIRMKNGTAEEILYNLLSSDICFI